MADGNRKKGKWKERMQKKTGENAKEDRMQNREAETKETSEKDTMIWSGYTREEMTQQRKEKWKVEERNMKD